MAPSQSLRSLKAFPNRYAAWGATELLGKSLRIFRNVSMAFCTSSGRRIGGGPPVSDGSEEPHRAPEKSRPAPGRGPGRGCATGRPACWGKVWVAGGPLALKNRRRCKTEQKNNEKSTP